MSRIENNELRQLQGSQGVGENAALDTSTQQENQGTLEEIRSLRSTMLSSTSEAKSARAGAMENMAQAEQLKNKAKQASSPSEVQSIIQQVKDAIQRAKQLIKQMKTATAVANDAKAEIKQKSQDVQGANISLGDPSANSNFNFDPPQVDLT